jgi:hypothetical protein
MQAFHPINESPRRVLATSSAVFGDPAVSRPDRPGLSLRIPASSITIFADETHEMGKFLDNESGD